MSELSTFVTAELFEKSFAQFVVQADKNKLTGKAQGSRTPFGFSKKVDADGAQFVQHFGQGAASKTPYMNWWVVSIYYLPENGRILLGIEENRYPHIKELQNVKMKMKRYERIGNKGTRVVVFYETDKNNVCYSELYESFIRVSEEVMHLGLN